MLFRSQALVLSRVPSRRRLKSANCRGLPMPAPISTMRVDVLQIWGRHIDLDVPFLVLNGDGLAARQVTNRQVSKSAASSSHRVACVPTTIQQLPCGAAGTRQDLSHPARHTGNPGCRVAGATCCCGPPLLEQLQALAGFFRGGAGDVAFHRAVHDHRPDRARERFLDVGRRRDRRRDLAVDRLRLG